MSTQYDDVKVTVWCLAYNHEKYIRKTLESIVAQKTNFKYEAIIHDDASTDGTAAIIKEFEEKYPDIIKPIYQKENQTQKGVDKMKEFLFPNAKGKYIAFCECDDYWCDCEKLQKQYDIMESNPDVSMCVHKVQCVNEDGSINSRVIPEELYQLEGSQKISQDLFSDFLFMKGGYPFHTSSYFIKTELIGSSEFNMLFGKMNGDQRIMRIALMFGNIYYSDEIFSCRRLFSIGNWNSRFRDMDAEKKLSFFLRNFNGEMTFDELSSYKYKNKIANNLFGQVIGLSIDYGSKKLKAHRKKIEEKYNINMIKSKKIKLKYFILKHTPFLFDLIYKIKKR